MTEESLSDTIDMFDKAKHIIKAIPIKDIKEFIQKLKDGICLRTGNEPCFNCKEIDKTFGEKLT